MTLDTSVSGNPASMRELARQLREIGAGVTETGGGWNHARTQSATEWDGPISEAFRNLAARSSRDAEALHELYEALARRCTAWSDAIRAVHRRMDEATTIARAASLTVEAGTIFPPEPAPLTGLIWADDSAAHVDEDPGAKVRHAHQQAAFLHAEAIVRNARRLERTAHQDLAQGVRDSRAKLDHLGQHRAWARAACCAHPVAAALVHAASTMESDADELDPA